MKSLIYGVMMASIAANKMLFRNDPNFYKESGAPIPDHFRKNRKKKKKKAKRK